MVEPSLAAEEIVYITSPCGCVAVMHLARIWRLKMGQT